MYIITVYDINEKRVGKVLKKCRKYLKWIQNSVFEGELTEGQFLSLKTELKAIIKSEEDSVIFYTFDVKNYLNRSIMGIEKSPQTNFL